MFRHKSLGLLTGMLVAPRLVYRVFSSGSAYNVLPLVGNKTWETSAGRFGHIALYGFMTVMPATGIAMGYYGGKGLPFFFTTIDGAKETNGAIAKQSFQIHKQLGIYGKYLIPLHIGAAAVHAGRGQAIFHRINPFRKRVG
jgi:cytochrome b561